MVIVLLQANIVALRAVAVHKCKVSDFNISCSLDSQSPAIDCCVFSDTFKCNSSRVALTAAINYDVALIHYAKVRNLTNKTNVIWSAVISLLDKVKNILKSRSRSLSALAAGHYLCCHCVLCLFSDIKNNGIAL